jgi:hypothetical protein
MQLVDTATIRGDGFMVKGEEHKNELGVMKYCLMSLAIGVCITCISYRLFALYIVPELIIGLFCFILKRKAKSVWENKKRDFFV